VVVSGAVRPPQPIRRRLSLRGLILSLALTGVLVGAVVVSAITGQLAVTASDVVGSILGWLGINTSLAPEDSVVEATLQVVRFPRIVMALAVGAAPMQTAFDHVVPLAVPGMLTGAIIGMARALGETAPLLMIGMVAFIVDIPESVFDAATVLPVQIFLWADSPERAFVAKMAAGIMVLLAFLIAMNLIAVILRRRFEQKW